MIETVRERGPQLGIAPTCAAFGLPTATYYRRCKPKPSVSPPRPSPPRSLAAEERTAVLEVLHEPRFMDLAPAAVWAQLLDEGRYLCSQRTMYQRRSIGGRHASRSAPNDSPTSGARSTARRSICVPEMWHKAFAGRSVL